MANRGIGIVILIDRGVMCAFPNYNFRSGLQNAFRYCDDKLAKH